MENSYDRKVLHYVDKYVRPTFFSLVLWKIREMASQPENKVENIEGCKSISVLQFSSFKVSFPKAEEADSAVYAGTRAETFVNTGDIKFTC